MWLSATKQPSVSGVDCILSPTAEGRVKKIIIMCSLFSLNCAPAPLICCYTHKRRLLKTEAKPSCGNGWQVTHSHVTVTNGTSA